MTEEKISATLTTIAPSQAGVPAVDNQQDKKANAALLAQIAAYAEEAEKVTNQTQGNGLGAENDPSTSDPDQSNQSDDSSTKLSPLLALLMAGITIESQTNGLMTSLGTMSSAMTTASTNAANTEADYLKNFYENGNVDGTIKKPIDNHGVDVRINPSGHVELSLDHGKTWTDAGGYDTGGNMHFALPDGVSLTQQQSDELHQVATLAYGDFKQQGYTGYTKARGDNDDKGTGVNGVTVQQGGASYYAQYDTKDQSAFISLYQQAQNDANTVNTQFGTLCGLAGTGETQLTQSVNTSEGDQSSTIQSQGSIASMVTNWAGV
jgi:hypothetical protein